MTSHLRALAAQVKNDSPAEVDTRVRIPVTDRDHEVNEAAADELIKVEGVYVRAGRLVEVVRDDAEVDPLAPVVGELGRHTVRDLLSTRCRFVRRSSGKWVKVSAPDSVVGRILERRQWPVGVRHLKGVTETPSMRPDGSLLTQSGYDPKTGLYLETNLKLDLEALANPTREDAVNACEQLLEVVCDFPFVKPEARSAWLAFCLTPFARPAIPGQCPLFLIDGNVPGSGKSRLCDSVAILASGRAMPRGSAPPHEEEWRKQLMSSLEAARQTVLFDNVAADFGSPTLDAILTGPTYTGRVLGTKEDRTFVARTIFAATGNNVQVMGDLRRRALHIRIESDMEKPEDRNDFAHPDLLTWVTEQRSRLATAALTVLRAFHIAGRPVQPGRWGSFESWHRLVRGAIVWAGLPDPDVVRQDMEASADPQVVAFRALLQSWSDVWGGTGLHLGEVLERLTPGPGQQLGEGLKSLRAALLELCSDRDGGLPSAKALGKQLTKLKGRPGPGGLKLWAKPGQGGILVWRVATGHEVELPTQG